MDCPNCGYYDTRVLDSRVVKGHMIRRRRTCVECGNRFTTYETVPIPQKFNDPEKRYYRRHIVEPVILEPKDWSEEEWLVFLKFFGMEYAERIILWDYHFEAYGIRKNDDDEEVTGNGSP